MMLREVTHEFILQLARDWRPEGLILTPTKGPCYWYVEKERRGFCCIAVVGKQRIARSRSLFVHVDHRRQGLARLMVAECMDLAAGMGCRAMDAHANPNSLHLYETLGFAPVGHNSKLNTTHVFKAFK